MLTKLAAIEAKYSQIEARLNAPETYDDPELVTSLNREQTELQPLVETYRAYLASKKQREDAEKLLSDPEMKSLAQEEFLAAKSNMEQLEGKLQILLLPKDPNDGKSVVVEIRAGVGGEEAALFAHSLHRMYTMYAEHMGWRTEVDSLSETELGGIKEINFMVIGEGAYSKFKFESGVHRVQRIPVTESNGKIQTSTVTVAVLAEADAVEVEVNPADIKIESCKSSGAGGQHINKTESAVRLTHKPTGIVIECDQERSQLQNKERALKILYTKLYDMKLTEQNEMIASTRKSQVGSGDRSEKIRTYNFPQSRVTDHRINKTVFNLQGFLNGDMDDIIVDLIAQDTAERLKGEANEY